MAFSPRLFSTSCAAACRSPTWSGAKVRLIRRGQAGDGALPVPQREDAVLPRQTRTRASYHCFGCGAHGDAIGFVMQTDGLEFPRGGRAARRRGRARRCPKRHAAGARARRAPGDPRHRHGSRLRLLRGAARRRRRPPAPDYLQRRGLTTRKRSRASAWASRRTAATALNDRSWPSGDLREALLIEAGLLIKPEDGGPTYDRFRGRVIFPIADRSGRIIAFGGRVARRRASRNT